ncbi:MAG: O-antigen ligase family protein [Candidatus Gracilibacteria bacterium]
MADLLNYCRKNFSFLSISAFWLVALLNPVFKKYDYGAEFPLVILFGVLVLGLAIHEFKNKREKVFLEPLFLIIFFLAISVSFYFSHTKNYGLSEVMAFSSMVPFYLLFAHKKTDWSEKFLKIVAVGVFTSVIIGFLFYFFGADTRVFGPFFNILYHANKWPNAFALFLLMGWPILLILHKGKFTALRVIGLSFVFGLFMLIYSRGAMIVLGGQILLLLAYFFKRIRLKTVILFFAIAILSAGVFVLANYVREFKYQTIDLEEKVSFENGESLTSMRERKDFWSGSVELMKDEPVFGWGPYSFRYAYNGVQKTFLGNSDHPHNIFLKIGVENGLIALGAFILFLITVLVTVIRRFPKLSPARKDFVYLILTAIAGAFAHNMIDYNLNFMANLLLLFTLLVIVRSSVAEKTTKERKSGFAVIISVIIAIFAVYEGGVLVLSQTANYAFLSYSFYPRDYYLSTAEKDISKDNFDEALELLKHEQTLNSLDARADYLESEIYCDKKSQSFNIVVCKDELKQTLALDPMNNFAYYRDYLRLVTPNNLSPDDMKIIKKSEELLKIYFDYVGTNIHFTAYTSNIEAAYEMAGLLIPHLDEANAKIIRDEKERMLKTAQALRANKEF